MTDETSDQKPLSFGTLNLGMPRDKILTADLGLCAGPIQLRYDADNRLTVMVDDGWTMSDAADQFIAVLRHRLGQT